MKSKLLVSVIIPNFNHARYLDERIKSVLNQTYQNFEVIILDDKSTDNSLEVINKYKDDPHISCVVVNEENSGRPCRQWNKGIRLAKGELIWIAESDDTCSCDFLEKLVAIHVSEQVVLAYCLSQEIDDDGRLMSTINRGVQEGVIEGTDFIDKYLGQMCVIANASSVVFKKRYVSYIPENYLYMEAAADWLFWIEMCRQGKIAFSCEALNYFRNHIGNTTKKQALTGKNYIMDKKILDYLYSQSLISRKAYNNKMRYMYKEICSRQFESDQSRNIVMEVYGYNTLLFRIKLFLSKVLIKIDCMLWGV